MLLEIISFNPSVIYNLAGFAALLVGLVGSFFKLQNAISLLKSENQNLKETMIKLEDKVSSAETKTQVQLSILEEKMEHKLSQLYDKVEKLPTDLAILFKNIIGKP